MLILHTTHTYAPAVDGVSEVVQQISKRLARRGHEIHVATAAQNGSPAEEVRDGVTIHRFRVRGNAVQGIKGEVSHYLEFVAARQWQVIGMHCAQSWPFDALLPQLPTLPGRKVFVAHGISRLGESAYEEYFSAMAARMASLDAFVGLSRLTEENDFARAFGLPLPEVVPNGVDVAQFSQAGADVRKEWEIGHRPWLLSVGNHNPNKGHSRLFRAVQLVRQAFPDVITTIIGGDYPAARWNLGRLGIKGGCWYRCRLQCLVNPEVRLSCGVPRSEVVSAFQQADVLVVPSTWEASPLVVLEAMAAGLPWVAFDIGCVRDHTGGVVVRTIEEMSKAVTDLLGNAGLRRELGEQGRARIVAQHDWERIVDRYEQLYESILRRDEAGAPVLWS